MVAACGKQRMAAAAAVTLQLLLLAATHAAAPAAASHGRLVHIEQEPALASDAQHPDAAQGGRSLHHSSGRRGRLQRQQQPREQRGQPDTTSGLVPTRQLRAVRLPHAQPGTDTRDIDARITSHWQEVTAICPDLAYRSCEGVDRSLWTDVYQTQVVDFNFYGLGQWSTFKLVTFDHHRRRRDRGGDSWHVLLRDRRQELKVPARVFDEGNGERSGGKSREEKRRGRGLWARNLVKVVGKETSSRSTDAQATAVLLRDRWQRLKVPAWSTIRASVRCKGVRDGQSGI